jgi:predicted nucleic-acid-binding Zn-ribbon protein
MKEEKKYNCPKCKDTGTVKKEIPTTLNIPIARVEIFGMKVGKFYTQQPGKVVEVTKCSCKKGQE